MNLRRQISCLLSAGLVSCSSSASDGSHTDAEAGQVSAANSGDDGAESGGSSSTDSGDSFDLGSATDTHVHPNGCDKLDLLFVVDNTVSMADEHENLKQSFPGFIAALETSLEHVDYRVMLVDTDSVGQEFLPCGRGSTCTDGVCTCDLVGCCDCICEHEGAINCRGFLCHPDAELPHPCDGVLGAGRDLSSITRKDCGFPGGRRYLVRSDPNLASTFACAASLGTSGHEFGRPMNAMERALHPAFNELDGCNAGFLRDDALLVVVVVSDEDEKGEDRANSSGDPESWRQSLIDTKLGNEAAIVALGLIGDRDLRDPQCEVFDQMSTGAEPSPVLRAFFNGLPHSLIGSVCEPDYGPFFTDAVDVIAQACGLFE